MPVDWLILGVISIVGAWLSIDISRAHRTLIALHSTLTALEGDVASIQDDLHGTLFALKADVAAIRYQVAPSAEDLQSL